MKADSADSYSDRRDAGEMQKRYLAVHSLWRTSPVWQHQQHLHLCTGPPLTIPEGVPSHTLQATDQYQQQPRYLIELNTYSTGIYIHNKLKLFLIFRDTNLAIYIHDRIMCIWEIDRSIFGRDRSLIARGYTTQYTYISCRISQVGFNIKYT